MSEATVWVFSRPVRRLSKAGALIATFYLCRDGVRDRHTSFESWKALLREQGKVAGGSTCLLLRATGAVELWRLVSSLHLHITRSDVTSDTASPKGTGRKRRWRPLRRRSAGTKARAPTLQESCPSPSESVLIA